MPGTAMNAVPDPEETAGSSNGSQILRQADVGTHQRAESSSPDDEEEHHRSPRIVFEKPDHGIVAQ